MKKLIVFLGCMILLAFAIARCSGWGKLELPFLSEDITRIELYHFLVPKEAEYKIITDREAIQTVWDSLNEIKVGRNDVPPIEGSETLSFRFYLKDGSDFEILYTSYGAKDGEIKSSYIFDYKTRSDVIALWHAFNVEALEATEDQLPTYEE